MRVAGTGMEAAVVPDMYAQPSGAPKLSVAQQLELEMARRRAEKAAEGKRENAAAAKARLKRKKGDQQAAASKPQVELPEERPPVDDEKEAKRLKRLLRNRVSAQQARERKKSYVQSIEEKCQMQDQQVQQLQQRVMTLERECVMLRQVIKNIKNNNEAVVPAL